MKSLYESVLDIDDNISQANAKAELYVEEEKEIEDITKVLINEIEKKFKCKFSEWSDLGNRQDYMIASDCSIEIDRINPLAECIEKTIDKLRKKYPKLKRFDASFPRGFTFIRYFSKSVEDGEVLYIGFVKKQQIDLKNTIFIRIFKFK